MVIDLPSSSQIIARGNQNPVTQLANQRLETLMTALKALNVQAGDSLTAMVKAVHPVDDALRARLIQQATPPSSGASLGANRNATAPESLPPDTRPEGKSPAGKAPEAAPTPAKGIPAETARLLQSPNLKLVEVEVRGQSVLAFTDRPLRPNQALTLQVQNQQLVIVGDKTATPDYRTHLSAALSGAAGAGARNPAEAAPATMPGGPTIPTTPTTATVTTTAGQAVLAGGTAAAPLPAKSLATVAQAALQAATLAAPDSSPRPMASPLPLTSTQVQTLQQALRAQLPAQAETPPSASALSHSLQLAQLLTQLVRQPGSEALQQQIPRTVQESLQQLAAHLRSPQQLAQPAALKQAITGSGLQLEHRLQHSVNQSPAATLAALPQTDVKAALLQTLHQLRQYAPAPAAANPASTTPGSTASAAATRPAAVMPGALNPAAITLPGPGASAPAGGPSASALPLISALQQLLQGSPQQRKATLAKLSADKVLQATRQQVLQALDKIQYLQLQTLQKQSAQSALPHQEGLSTMHLQLEIPLNWGYGAQSIGLSIDEDWVTDYSDETAGRKEKVQQWQVKLSFELPDAGSLHAHLTVVRDQLSASLWAEQAETFALTQASLQSLRQQLEKDGCTVKQLECFHGRPVAEEPMRLNYSLIDIQT